jgi:hypothetical protein
VDALRLLAVFLADWDNKAENQRLVCLRTAGAKDAPCAEPFAVVQDLGATFGPQKVDLEGWKGAPVWADAVGCRVSMKALPFGGGTFQDAVISEEGRALLSGLLSALSRRQVESLFTAARFAETAGPFGRPRPVAEWADVFEAKVREIAQRRCAPARGASAPRKRRAPSARGPALAHARSAAGQPAAALRRTPASMVSPVRLIAWKCRESPAISTSMKCRSAS